MEMRGQCLLVVIPLRALGFRVDSCSAEVLRDCSGRPISLDPELAEIIASERWETDSSFPEVPSHLLSSHSWKKVMADEWFSTRTSSDLKPGPWSKQPIAQLTASTRLQDIATQ